MKTSKTLRIDESVAEVVPLKQGLKLHDSLADNTRKVGCRGSSIKTRIETLYIMRYYRHLQHVAEVVPLKQGLKLFRDFLINCLSEVAEVVPLKQGLKHN